MTQPPDREDAAFWSFLIISQIWAAGSSSLAGMLMAIPWLLLAVWIRWPHWTKGNGNDTSTKNP